MLPDEQCFNYNRRAASWYNVFAHRALALVVEETSFKVGSVFVFLTELHMIYFPWALIARIAYVWLQLYLKFM